MRIFILFGCLLAATNGSFTSMTGDMRHQPISWPFVPAGYVGGKTPQQWPQNQHIEKAQSSDPVRESSDLEKLPYVKTPKVNGKVSFLKAKPQSSSTTTANPTQMNSKSEKYFPEMDPALSGALMAELAKAGIDSTMMDTNVTMLGADTTKTAVSVTDRFFIERSPLGCRNTLALHAMVGFCRVTLDRVLNEQRQMVVMDYRNMNRMRTTSDSLQPVVDEKTMKLWHIITDKVEVDLDEKLATWVPSTVELRQETTYAPFLTALTLAAVHDQTLAEMLDTVSAVNQIFMAPFTGTNTTCDVTGSIVDLAKHVKNLEFFLANDTQTYFDVVQLPTDVRTMMNARMTMTMRRMATQMSTYTKMLAKTPMDVTTTFRQAAEREGMERLSMIAMLKAMVREETNPDFMFYVNREVNLKGMKPMMEMIFRSMALSSADMNMSENEATMLLRDTAGMMTVYATPDVISTSKSSVPSKTNALKSKAH